ncbi:hypothetical protein HNY73_005226 [Argiope bruennichi]|uniref:Uncharacterized protein n=1 Tax=Argiope bruennichi TaxID=94029 RepID=A0A8T0FGP8_ARGBR|nr:hypothetical protein HNY73_005226 [Argiope bruennichi]
MNEQFVKRVASDYNSLFRSLGWQFITAEKLPVRYSPGVPFRTDIASPFRRQTRRPIVPRRSITELYKRMFVEKTTQSPAIGSFCGMRNHGFSSAEMIWTGGELFGRRGWPMLSMAFGAIRARAKRRETTFKPLIRQWTLCTKRDLRIKLHFPEARVRDDIHHKRKLDTPESRFRRIIQSEHLNLFNYHHPFQTFQVETSISETCKSLERCFDALENPVRTAGKKEKMTKEFYIPASFVA